MVSGRDFSQGRCLAKISVTEQEISRNPGGTEHAQTVCTRSFFFHSHVTAGMETGLDSLSVRETMHNLNGHFIKIAT